MAYRPFEEGLERGQVSNRGANVAILPARRRADPARSSQQSTDPPVPSELIYVLVILDKQYTAEDPGEPWERCSARQIIDHYRPQRT